MLLLLRSLTALALVSSTVAFEKSSSWLHQRAVQRLQTTRNCFRCGFTEANLVGVDLAKGHFKSIDLQKANLNQANLEAADFEWADLRAANLEGADLRSANLVNVDLSNASLKGADLQGANLEGAYWRDADLTNANLLGASEFAIMHNMTFCNTTLPDGTVSHRDCQQL